MKGRHCSLICSCPHCANTGQDNSDREMLTLTDFEAHVEVHRGHAYICFHCLETFKYENDLRNHAEIVHQLSEIRLEQIRCNIMIQETYVANSVQYSNIKNKLIHVLLSPQHLARCIRQCRRSPCLLFHLNCLSFPAVHHEYCLH
uniref:C2H2-type domain-containing protein n=1 Tax=Glossina pallidipes TaxID=7398 RepID=A0A1B0AEI6_GLOPL